MRAVVGLVLLLVGCVLRFWFARRSVAFCLAFWAILVMGGMFYALSYSGVRRWAWVVMVVGYLSNATAMLANGGGMPVVGKIWAEHLWVPVTRQTRLLFLCDTLPGGFSVGDFVVISGILVLILERFVSIWRR